MPQLDSSSFASQLFWLTVSFVALYMLLAYFLLPRVQNVLDRRTDTIDDDLSQAERMKWDAEAARTHYEKALAEARAKSHELFSKSLAEQTAHALKQQADLDAVVEKKLEQSDAAIKRASKEVMDKLTPVSGELASLIVEVLVHHKPGAKEVGAVIDGLAKGNL